MDRSNVFDLGAGASSRRASFDLDVAKVSAGKFPAGELPASESGDVPTFVPVAPNELRGAWAIVKDRVARIASKLKEPWVPEDVFCELLTGNSSLYLADDNSGFVVLRVFATAYQRSLFVWICWNDAGENRCLDYLPQLMDIAVGNGCSKIDWESPRKWQRALPGVRTRFAYSIEVGG